MDRMAQSRNLQSQARISNPLIQGLRISVKGIVQGVGFRPFVYTTADHLNLTGWVINNSSGVEIELNGSQEALDEFIRVLKSNPPVLARIDDLQVSPIPANGYTRFEILSSESKAGEFVPISPDVAICDDCRRELFDPSNRRYRYPFINCTNCGPRFSIIRDIPYDRPKTTMSQFEMCPDCQAEYDDPLDRRFHAQPTACPVCGPQVWFTDGKQQLAEKDDAIRLAREWLKAGKIIAIKGLGGYHLACDAENASAVHELRLRKKRSDKPFALMAFDLETIQQHCLCKRLAKIAAGISSASHCIAPEEREWQHRRRSGTQAKSTGIYAPLHAAAPAAP